MLISENCSLELQFAHVCSLQNIHGYCYHYVGHSYSCRISVLFLSEFCDTLQLFNLRIYVGVLANHFEIYCCLLRMNITHFFWCSERRRESCQKQTHFLSTDGEKTEFTAFLRLLCSENAILSTLVKFASL